MIRFLENKEIPIMETRCPGSQSLDLKLGRMWLLSKIFGITKLFVFER